MTNISDLIWNLEFWNIRIIPLLFSLFNINKLSFFSHIIICHNRIQTFTRRKRMHLRSNLLVSKSDVRLFLALFLSLFYHLNVIARPLVVTQPSTAFKLIGFTKNTRKIRPASATLANPWWSKLETSCWATRPRKKSRRCLKDLALFCTLSSLSKSVTRSPTSLFPTLSTLWLLKWTPKPSVLSQVRLQDYYN